METFGWCLCPNRSSVSGYILAYNSNKKKYEMLFIVPKYLLLIFTMIQIKVVKISA